MINQVIGQPQLSVEIARTELLLSQLENRIDLPLTEKLERWSLLLEHLAQLYRQRQQLNSNSAADSEEQGQLS